MKILFYSLLILSLLGALSGLLISFLSDILKVEEDEKVDIVLKLLPGYNCGACGKSGCLWPARTGDGCILLRNLTGKELNNQMREAMTQDW